ncbi:hypothetical protein [Devosia sp. LjRoot3]|uniref:hypothetical protein n=1 Tax=Devosia sp. LjRoot3 TaxID=3342319 RepID=UPI003ECEB269
MSVEEVIMDPNSDDIPIAQIALPGNLAHELEYVGSTNMTLLVSVGKLVGSENLLLVPFVDLDIDVDTDVGPEAETALSASISFDNAAFTVCSLADNLSMIADQLVQMSSGELKPDPGRVEVSKHFVSQAEGHLRRCLESLSQLGNQAKPTSNNR